MTHKDQPIFVWFLILLCYANAYELGLDSWLHNFTIPIKHTNFTNNQGTLIIDGIVCNNITFNTFSSTLVSTLDINLASSSMEMNCVGNWNLTSTTGNVTGTGTMGMNVSTTISLGITLIPNSTYNFIGGVDATCDMQVSTASLVFYNDSTQSLSSFDSEVEGYFNAQIPTLGCSSIVQQTSVYLLGQFSSFDTWAVDIITGTSNQCLMPQNQCWNVSTSQMYGLQNNSIMSLVNYVLNDAVGTNGPVGLNVIVNRFTNNTGSVSFDYANSSLIKNLSFTSLPAINTNFGTVTLTPQWINISGLNTWTTATFVEPITNQTLETYTVLDNLGLSFEFIVNITFKDPTINGGPMIQKSILKTTLAQNKLLAQTFLGISKQDFSFLAPSQMLAPGCLAHTIDILGIVELSLNFTVDDIQMISSPDQVKTPQVDLVNNGITMFLQSIAPSMDAILYGFMWGGELSINALNYRLPVYYDNTTCHDPVYDGRTFNKITTLAACVAAVGIFFLLVVASYLIVRFYEADYAESSTTGEDYAQSVPYKINAADRTVGRETQSLLGHPYSGYALMVNPAIPVVIRYGVVLFLLLNAALFIASNTGLGASVYLIVRTPDGITQFPSLFDFSLVNSIRDMWNAKVYALSILIALFSGVWPYTKLVLLLLCWCTPIKILNLQRRGRILIMLDAMGKWSLIDSFVLILMMVAFHFSLAPPVSSYTPPGTITFEAYVKPHFGFYSFLVATMFSLVITHFVIKVHQRSLETAVHQAQRNNSNTKEPLWTHAFPSDSHPHKAAYMLTAVTVLIISSGVLLGFGINQQSFDFTFRGAFGVLLRFLGQADQIAFSVISLGVDFPGSAMDPDSVGTRFIQVSFFMFAIAMPIAYLICLLVLWMVPLTYQLQSRLLTLTTTIHAWSALEVFVISIIAALLELQQFAQFIIGNRCDMINKILAAYGNEILHGDDKCFDVVATLKTGCWVLFAACVIYVVVGSLVVKGCHNALKGRLGRPGVMH